MQVFGLPGQIIKNGRAASRLLAAQTPDIEGRRRDAVARWRRARADGLNAEQAAGGRRSPFDALSLGEGRRAEKPAAAARPAEDVDARLAASGRAVAAGLSHVGGAKIGPRLRAEGFEVSDATVGRMLAELVACGVVQAMPTLRRWPHARRAASPAACRAVSP
jgi:putative transposase